MMSLSRTTKGPHPRNVKYVILPGVYIVFLKDFIKSPGPCRKDYPCPEGTGCLTSDDGGMMKVDYFMPRSFFVLRSV